MRGLRAAVLGAGGGIGAALVSRLAAAGCKTIYAGPRAALDDRRAHVHPFLFDLLSESGLAEASKRIAAEGPLDLVFVATGTLHRDGVRPEKSVRQIDAAAMQDMFAVNSIGPGTRRKIFPAAPRARPARDHSLSVGPCRSIGDNRPGGWHSYRASKAALNALVRCLAIELASKNREAIAVALHPGTVDTRLSRPFQRHVAPARIFRPEASARNLLSVIDGLGPADSGGFFAWDESRIEY